MDAADLKRLKDRANQAHEQYVEAVLDVTIACIREFMGEEPSDRLRDKLYDAIRFDI